jgi:peptide/nickel transport system ATP-binding protein
MPRLDEVRADRLIPIKGTPPSLINVPSGCPFHPRCDYAVLTDGKSESQVPELREIEPGHKVACHLSRDQRTTLRTERVASLARVDGEDA